MIPKAGRGRFSPVMAAAATVCTTPRPGGGAGFVGGGADWPSLALWVRCARGSFTVWNLAHLDRRQAGDDRITCPLERLVHVSGLQYRKTASVLLSSQIRAVGDEHFAIGLRPQRVRLAGRAEAGSDKPRQALCGRVEVVGEVTRNQIMQLRSRTARGKRDRALPPRSGHLGRQRSVRVARDTDGEGPKPPPTGLPGN